MVAKTVKKLICAYFAISLALMAVCLGIAAVDCVNKAHFGEFTLLPVLNVVQFSFDPDAMPDEQDEKMLVEAVAFIEQLYWDGHGSGDPLWQFINLATAVALCNLPICYLLRLFDVQLPRFTVWSVWIAGAIAVVLTAAVRIYVRNCYGASEVKFRYPIAYITWRDLFLPALVLAVLTGVRKLLREE